MKATENITKSASMQHAFNNAMKSPFTCHLKVRFITMRESTTYYGSMSDFEFDNRDYHYVVTADYDAETLTIERWLNGGYDEEYTKVYKLNIL